MRVLLDTQLALWAILDDPRLSEDARAAITGADTVAVSVVSLWEIAIKHSLDRGDMPLDSARAQSYFDEAGYDLSLLRPATVHELTSLPLLHRDPFDRILIAQARTEGLVLLTRDRAVAGYGEFILLV